LLRNVHPHKNARVTCISCCQCEQESHILPPYYESKLSLTDYRRENITTMASKRKKKLSCAGYRSCCGRWILWLFHVFCRLLHWLALFCAAVTIRTSFPRERRRTQQSRRLPSPRVVLFISSAEIRHAMTTKKKKSIIPRKSIRLILERRTTSEGSKWSASRREALSDSLQLVQVLIPVEFLVGHQVLHHPVSHLEALVHSLHRVQVLNPVNVLVDIQVLFLQGFHLKDPVELQVGLPVLFPLVFHPPALVHFLQTVQVHFPVVLVIVQVILHLVYHQEA